jgi:hypothetical protein
MAKKKKKQHLTRDERITQECADGFVVKHYSIWEKLIVLYVSIFLSLILPILILRRWELPRVVVLLLIMSFLFLGIFLAIRIIVATGTTVNLKITKVGLEQTKMSRSVLVPQKRIVEWENMKSCRIHLGLFIRTKKGKNYRLEPYPYRGGMLRYGYGDILDDFLWEFERLAKQHKIKIK